MEQASFATSADRVREDPGERTEAELRNMRQDGEVWYRVPHAMPHLYLQGSRGRGLDRASAKKLRLLLGTSSFASDLQPGNWKFQQSGSSAELLELRGST